ncbi:MAG: laminin G domain-containing protein, partial [Caldilineaceae bacterium]|nr:laminin G domain-containing protein [Caldilineaceae bacterium]
CTNVWDSDGDGLSDLFETQRGSKPGAADSDQDGLNDRMELLLGTDPLTKDSDGDGLLDGQEVFHQDDQGNWVGGWEFVYDIVDGVPLRTWVTSDPLDWNGDRDTFTDYQEWLYGLHPKVVSDPTILKLKSQLAERSAPVTLLRFDERAAATVFADSSGKGNSASCSGGTCPQAGHEGRYTNGLVFDGVDDVIQMAEAVPLGDGSFTVAMWARRTETGRADLVFGSRDTARNEQMWLGFGATDEFLCGFTADSVLSSQPITGTDWRHWACTYDFTRPVVVGDVGTVTATLYLDGEVVETRTFSRALGYLGSGVWLIGGSYDRSGNYVGFSGTLDEFVVAPVALNQRQVRQLMQGQYNVGGDRMLVAPGDGLSYEAELENNLLGRTLTGLLSVDAPTGWVNNGNLSTYQLAPTQALTLPGNLTVGDNTATGPYSVTVSAGAAASVPNAPAAATLPASDAYFSFDNASSRLTDSAGRQATTRAGSSSTTTGVGVGSALSLNGSTVLEVANDNIFDVSNTAFTYSVWVKPDAGAGYTRAIFGQPPAGREWWYDNAGAFLRVQNDKDLIFGWGEAWNTDPIANVLTPGAWNHVAVTYDRSTLKVYVNGVQEDFFTPNSSPRSRSVLSIGDDNYCGEFEFKNAHTKKEGDPGEPSAEYVYRFQDDQGNKDTLLEDTDADSGEWEPGNGPSNSEWFTDKQRTFCYTGARVYVYEDDPASDDSMSPDVHFDITTPQKVGYNNTNYSSFWSPDIKGDGTVEFYYEVRNPVLPFKGGIDELRLYRRALSEKEVQQLYNVASVPYHYTLDDPPGSGLDDVFAPTFNFANEGAVADARVQGTCSTSCPTSGLPGRVNRAVSFGYIGSDGMQIAQGIRIQNLSLPQTAPGFSLWVKPQQAGVFLSIYKDQSTLISSLFFSPENRLCISDAASSGAPACSANTYRVGEWVHTMINFSGNAMTLHLNNSEQVTYQKSSAAWPGAGTYSVSLSGTSFMGLLDDLRIPYDGS